MSGARFDELSDTEDNGGDTGVTASRQGVEPVRDGCGRRDLRAQSGGHVSCPLAG